MPIWFSQTSGNRAGSTVSAVIKHMEVTNITLYQLILYNQGQVTGLCFMGDECTTGG